MIKRYLVKLPGWLLIWFYALLVILPLYFTIITCFKTSTEITLDPFGLPNSLSFENFRVAITQGNLVNAMKNSMLTSVGATIIQVIIGISVSYCLYKLRDSKIGVLLYMVVLATLFIPGTGWVTLIKLYQKLGLYNSIWGVLLNSGTGRLAFNTFILVGAMHTVPKELEQAALIDGCNDLQYLFGVLAPCIKPSLVSIAIFAFTSSWNSLMTPLLLLRKEEAFTLPLALKYLQSGTGDVIQYNYVFAGIVFSGFLLVVLYLFCQKYFVTALAGSVKG